MKEYDVATDVFRRSTDFDQSTDAIVRVEMHRLRKKLKEYYAQEAEATSLEIVLPVGRYVPEFVVPPTSSLIPALTNQVIDGTKADTNKILQRPLGTPELTEVSRGNRWLIFLGCLLVLVLATVGVVWSKHTARAEETNLAIATPDVTAAAAAPVGESIRIRCGSDTGAKEDREGHVWSSDAFFSGGLAVTQPVESVFRTRDPFLFQTMRTGEFSYKIPLKPGTYELRLYFAETGYRPGVEMEGAENVRVFTIWLNDAALLRDFDIASDGGANTADIKVFKDVRPAGDGYLHLRFGKQTDVPILNAIEIVPGIPHRLRPLRISTQERKWTDRFGNAWLPDMYFLNGRSMSHVGNVIAKGDPQLYGHERYGNFSYAIPVARGHYRVQLHFAETYWGTNGPGGGGVASRLFDVYCNGRPLLKNFDLYKEAGMNTEFVKTFEHVEPNAQGKLLLSFVPSKNYATISGIEVIDEGE